MKKVFKRLFYLVLGTIWIFGIPFLWPLVGITKWTEYMDKWGKEVL